MNSSKVAVEERFNKNLIKANIELQDENRWLKIDIERLKQKINQAMKLYENGKYSTIADDMYRIVKKENNE